MTAVGPVRVTRDYLTGSGDDPGGFRADEELGIEGYLTGGATRMAALAGVGESFAKASRVLSELAGWVLDDDTIRLATHATARRAAATRPERPDAARFAEAPGAVEVPIDAGKVNTTGGWRDVKVAVFAKREEGEPAAPKDWDDRELPPPTVRTVVAAVEGVDAFAERLKAEADRLGVTGSDDVTVLGDGAAWIWNLAGSVLPQAKGVLDVYHAAEHIASAAKAVWGEGTARAAAGLEEGRSALIAEGLSGLEAWIGRVFAEMGTGVGYDALISLAAYATSHTTRLDYADRLQGGRSIGSGLIEGTIKQLINLRLKRTGARWSVENVGPLVELVALADSPEWQSIWTAI